MSCIRSRSRGEDAPGNGCIFASGILNKNWSMWTVIVFECINAYNKKGSYYCIDFNEVNGKHKVTGQPGVGDVTK